MSTKHDDAPPPSSPSRTAVSLSEDGHVPQTTGKDAEKSAPALDEEVAVKPPAIEFPEGGLAAWACVFGAFLVLFSTFGYVNA